MEPRMLLSLKTIQYSMNMRCVLCVWDTTSGNITQIYCRMWLCNAKCFQSFYSLRFGRLRMHKIKQKPKKTCRHKYAGARYMVTAMMVGRVRKLSVLSTGGKSICWQLTYRRQIKICIVDTISNMLNDIADLCLLGVKTNKLEFHHHLQSSFTYIPWIRGMIGLAPD